jgi:hypothetical protein
MASGKSKKKKQGSAKGIASNAGADVQKPGKSEAALIADIRSAIKDVGTGFDASAPDRERIATMLGDLEDTNGKLSCGVSMHARLHMCACQQARTASSHRGLLGALIRCLMLSLSFLRARLLILQM